MTRSSWRNIQWCCYISEKKKTIYHCSKIPRRRNRLNAYPPSSFRMSMRRGCDTRLVWNSAKRSETIRDSLGPVVRRVYCTTRGVSIGLRIHSGVAWARSGTCGSVRLLCGLTTGLHHLPHCSIATRHIAIPGLEIAKGNSGREKRRFFYFLISIFLHFGLL